MDELVIGDKKYISSKLAAKATGYAKDYIGQLCREGRVPARLVGRGWYVLESAIHDHRFGSPKNGPTHTEKSAVSRMQSTGEAPRYEALVAETIPSVNRLRGGESAELMNDKNNDNEIAGRLQETWQAWFDRFDYAADTTTAAGPMPVVEETGKESHDTEEGKEQKEEIGQNHEVQVPIRAVYQSQPPAEALMPRARIHNADAEAQSRQTMRHTEQRSGKGIGKIIKMSGMLMAIAAILLAVLGSGYLDKYIISNSQVGIIAGVVLYNK